MQSLRRILHRNYSNTSQLALRNEPLVNFQSAPTMQHRYQQFQSAYPNHTILLQVGDFYEIYGERAETIARLLDINLTRTPKNGVAMTGFPIRSLDNFLAKFVKARQSVVICDQFPIGSGHTGRFDRKITRIVTPGTVLEDGLLDKFSNNYVMAVTRGSEKNAEVNLSWLDVSTGDFFIAKCEGIDKFEDFLVRLRPKEVVFSGQSGMNEFVRLVEKFKISKVDFDSISNTHTITENNMTLTSRERESCNLLLSYIQSTQISSMPNLKTLKRWNRSEKMILDADAFKALDIMTNSADGSDNHTLFDCLNECKTAMGSRLLSKRLQSPSTDIQEIERSLESVEALVVSQEIRTKLRRLLDNVCDIERAFQRVCTKRPVGTARDLLLIVRSLNYLKNLEVRLECPVFQDFLLTLKRIDWQLLEMIEQSIDEKPPLRESDGGFIKSGFNQELDKITDSLNNFDRDITDLENKYRRSTGILTLRIIEHKSERVIEVSKVHQASLSADQFRCVSQTESKARFITDELVTLQFNHRTVSSRIVEKELEILEELRVGLVGMAKELSQLIDSIAELDLTINFAHLAVDRNYRRPRLNTSTDLIIKHGRHPVLDKLFTAALKDFSYNCTDIGEASGKFVLLTGPNMGGKSTYLRQNALIAIMAQCGAFVPAAEATIGIVDAIYTRIGASDDLSKDTSTFMKEMSETGKILKNATERSLVIMDEIGRGTAADEGLALAFAIAQYLIKNIGCRTLFATHYFDMVSALEDLQNPNGMQPLIQYHCTTAKYTETGELLLIPKIGRGSVQESFAIPVARIAGLPEEVLVKSREYLETSRRGRDIPNSDMLSQIKAILEGKLASKKKLDLINTIIKNPRINIQ